MKKIIALILIFVALLVLTQVLSWYVLAGESCICHVPPGNLNNAHTICIDDNGYNGHFDNEGVLHNLDYLGECVEPSPTASTSATPTESPLPTPRQCAPRPTSTPEVTESPSPPPTNSPTLLPSPTPIVTNSPNPTITSSPQATSNNEPIYFPGETEVRGVQK